jgi:hypothetical protein
MGRRVLVCGGRDYVDQSKLADVLDAEHAREPFDVLISGMAKGADSLGAAWAVTRGIDVLRFPADWDKHGRAAGPIRNQQMLDEGKPTHVIAFPGGRGTADMINRAGPADVPVRMVK